MHAPHGVRAECLSWHPPRRRAFTHGARPVCVAADGDHTMCWSYQMAPCAHHTNSSKYPACTGGMGKAPACARSCVDNKQLEWKQDKHYGQGGYSVCGQGMTNGACAEKMAQEIYQHGPITGMFFVHQSFTMYKSGIYHVTHPFKDPMLGGHAIKIMGFGEEAGTQYWCVGHPATCAALAPFCEH